MELIVDTNILFSFFRENPVRFIIINSDLFGIRLFTAAYNIDELMKNKPDLLKYSKLTSEQIEPIIDELSKYISSISSDEYKLFEQEAKQLIHDKDVPIFALALKLGCAIWSNEPGFKKQSKVEIFNTKALRKLLGA